MIKAVIFDLDDTLIPETEYIEGGFKYIAKLLSDKIQMDESIIFNDLIKLFNIDSKMVFNRFFEKQGIDYSEAMILELVTAYRMHFPNIKFYDYVIPCLNKLKQKKIKTGIITDGHAIQQRQKLLAVEAEKYFDEIILTDELGRDFWKPHPKAFELMREKLNTTFEQMIYVGDNPEKDFYINKIYSIYTVRIVRNKQIYFKKEYFDGIKENKKITELDSVNFYKLVI